MQRMHHARTHALTRIGVAVGNGLRSVVVVVVVLLVAPSISLGFAALG